MNILVVCQYYYPEQFQINDICEQLILDGYKVDVLTGLPNYPSGNIPEEYTKGKRRFEVINGVNVYRTYEIGRKKGAVSLAKNYISYMLSSAKWARKNKKKYDLVFVYQLSPVFMAYAGTIIKKRLGIPMILYCCDLWPESMKLIINNEKNIIYKIVKKISSSLYKKADKILVQSKSFITYFENVHSIENEKIEYIPQFGNSDLLTINETLDNGIVDFVFLGNIGIAQDVATIIEAVNINREIEGFCIHFVGDGSYLTSAQKLVEELSLQNKIKFYGRRPLSEMPEFYKIADVCLVTLKADTVVGKTLPSKVQGYMAAGKPILAALDGSARDVIQEAKCGVCVPAGNVTELAKALKSFVNENEQYSECGKKAREYFEKYFTKEVFMNDLENVFDSYGE